MNPIKLKKVHDNVFDYEFITILERYLNEQTNVEVSGARLLHYCFLVKVFHEGKWELMDIHEGDFADLFDSYEVIE